MRKTLYNTVYKVCAFGNTITVTPSKPTGGGGVIPHKKTTEKADKIAAKRPVGRPRKNAKKTVKKAERARPVVSFEVATGRMQWWGSASYAAGKLRLCKSGVLRALDGEIPYVGGYKWRYANAKI